ncbi:MAG: nucleoside-diphosphate kinase [Candidatus Nanoarchaeia archaeon]|nr:nucleoside-diphosphate kinase [Candidatus Nanoarchaeia archaeon]
MNMIEKTLVLLKPDAVQRGLIGEIITRFEKMGLKIVGMKMFLANEKFASEHYSDVKERRGEKVFMNNVKFLSEGPVVAICIEGVHAIEIVRKLVGATEPKAALPGTIRGDYAHVSYSYADEKNTVVRNLIHASSSKEDAEKEIKLWFKKDELYSYKTVHEKHTL